MYYAFIENNKINGVGECRQLTEGVTNFEITEEIYNDIERYMWNGSDVILDPDYEEKQAQKERQRLDQLTLTPADVERALYRAKGMDFEDLKALIAQQIPTIDIKALAIEFRAKDFYRGAVAGGMRLFDVVGQLLGYTPADMDYLFEHKELPSEEVENVD
jgi:hypothetical protein